MRRFKGSPYISDIFLLHEDQNTHIGLESFTSNIRFVDDFLVIFYEAEHGCNVVNIQKAFRECGLDLKFIAKENEIQFIDLSEIATRLHMLDVQL